MAMLIGGLYLRMNSQVRHVMTAAYSDDAHLFHWFCYAAIAAGAITTFVGFLGCCSAYQESRCMLATVSPSMINFIHQAVDKYNETNTGK